ncbi:GGDEF domain-containing protein [Acidobacteria bacterium AB60]|nr:GGDEF domain-containing protein [Acidobacteria bacterium AB60]
MPARNHKLVRWSALTSAAIVLLMCGLAVYFCQQFFQDTRWVTHSTAVIGEIRATRAQIDRILAAPAGQPPVSIAVVLDQFDRAAQMTRDNALEQQSCQDFRRLLSKVNGRDPQADLANLQGAHAILGNMQAEEYRLLTVRTRTQAEASRDAALAVSALCGALICLGIIMTLAARREFRLRAKAEKALQADKDELTRYARELALVSAGSELLQAAQDEKQLTRAVAQILGEMLPEASGYFALLSPSKDIVEICESWGDNPVPNAFPPSACVALQLGRKVHRSESLVHIPCKHVNPDADSICMPLRSPTGFLGVIHVESANPIATKRADSIALFTAQITLALTNLRMRDALRSQSVRDPLTGLFNRRYFDETLQRELAAYRRGGASLCVLMLDLDHFKRVNDTFGHAAGDDALRALGRLMRSTFRESDVICRYGGEEFAVILMNADLESAFAKAEMFRSAVERIDISSQGRDLGRMTTSVGVACCSEFDDAAKLVHAADAALYQAKRRGRNGTCVCSLESGALPAIQPSLALETHWPNTDTALNSERAHRTTSRILPISAPPTRPV